MKNFFIRIQAEQFYLIFPLFPFFVVFFLFGLEHKLN